MSDLRGFVPDKPVTACGASKSAPLSTVQTRSFRLSSSVSSTAPPRSSPSRVSTSSSGRSRAYPSWPISSSTTWVRTHGTGGVAERPQLATVHLPEGLERLRLQARGLGEELLAREDGLESPAANGSGRACPWNLQSRRSRDMASWGAGAGAEGDAARRAWRAVRCGSVCPGRCRPPRRPRYVSG